VTNGHWHLNSKDVAANEKIFVAMGGKAFQAGGRRRVVFPGVIIILDTAPGAPPPSGPSRGSVVNHVGFIVDNVQREVAKWRAAGGPVEPGSNGRLDQAYANTPDGLRIEILENKNQSGRFRASTSTSSCRKRRYRKVRHGTERFSAPTRVSAITRRSRTFRVYSFASPRPKAPRVAPRAAHTGFDVKDLNSFIKTLEASNIKLDRPYTVNGGGVGIAFITDPWGTYIEINERPAQ
jgi:hypothetical protein